MSSLVDELQRESIDPKSSVAHLLRKAKVVAVKLDLPDLTDWISSEIGGYKSESVPLYRQTTGLLKAWNPYNGWIPVRFADDETARAYSFCRLTQSIAEIEDLARAKSSSYVIKFSSVQMSKFMAMMDLPLEPRLEIAGTVPLSIVDAVRNVILDWSLLLEKAGIKGNGMSFSERDKQVAHEPAAIYKINSIGTFTGNLGSVHDRSNVNADSVLAKASLNKTP